jgi:deazaflavin-dependent oxidoreductase (nitroreductase family)
MSYLYGKEHVERYLATDGAEGFDWRNGTSILLLFTTGRKTGAERVHPLIFREIDGRYVIVASKGGAPESPTWYENLQATPEVLVQVKGDRFKAIAHTAGPEEKPALWEKMVEVWPAYEEYQQKTDREIPVVVLEPI